MKLSKMNPEQRSQYFRELAAMRKNPYRHFADPIKATEAVSSRWALQKEKQEYKNKQDAPKETDSQEAQI